MQPGIYEQIVNLLLGREIQKLPNKVLTETIDPAESHDLLSQYVYRVLAQGLAQLRPSKDKGVSKLQKQIEICNQIISSLQNAGVAEADNLSISPEAKRLLAILEDASTTLQTPTRPDTPLALGALLTGTRQDPSFVCQLQKEIVSANAVDILCSFIKWSGIRILESALRIFTARENTRLRIITTSYMGATDLKAICFLAGLPNTEIKVSYDTHRTRLHAKAYLVHRKTGFSSAYVGSANISQAALTDGLEWNVKISQYEQPFQWDKIAATFDTYWNESEFETFNGHVDKERLQRALSQERKSSDSDQFELPNFDLRPYGFQQEILDRIASERELQQRNKHLIVAATGTGKTMIAAFDYKSWLRNRQNARITKQPRFLFVAHREEILRQSLFTFRAVLRNQNFGDLMVGGNRPEQLDQLFISIQTYNSQNLSEVVSSRHYDYVVVDEFHRAAAPSYRDLLDHIQPLSLLGLTATPERADGNDIKQYFDDHVTAEIRLPDAINLKLLCPFQYFGISDSVDYSSLRWQKGGYVQSDLEKKLTGNDIRAALIIEKTVETVLDIHSTRGLGFCVSKAHAEYMAYKFNEANIPADFLISDSSREHRNTVQGRLCNREINFIFVVDLYNEGVDIPQVDTILFLRPTESLTVFLQQLGRGLRLTEDKDCLTVLDFVGQAHKKFRFDIRLRALLTDRNRQVLDEINEGFPYLPAGCSIQFEKQAQQYILENIRHSISRSKPQIIQDIANFTSETGLSLNLKNFVEYHRLELDDIYRRASWTRLCVEAGVREDFRDPEEMRLTKGLRRLHHINDLCQINRLLDILTFHKLSMQELSSLDKKRLMMLFISLWGTNEVSSKIESNFNKLNANSTLKAELIDLLNLRKNAVVSIPPVKQFDFECPLELHSNYSRDEILIALGYWDLNSQPAMREGVLYIPELKTDAFFVTLNKIEKHYSPTTMYEDYAINETLFHWQSQSTTKEDSATGLRYINHRKTGNTILLFVRENRTNENNFAEPYHFLGSANYITHHGSKPMSITWRLHNPMPAYLWRKTSRLIVG